MVKMDICHGNCRRKGKDGVDPRNSVGKQRTRPLGQHVRCWYCGAHYVWGDNGITDHLMCSASREWKCWNSIGFNGPLATERLLAAITNKLGNIGGIEEQYHAILESAMSGTADDDRVRVDLESQQSALEREKLKIKEVILTAGHQPLLGEMLEDLNSRERQLALQWQTFERRKRTPLKLPATPMDLRKHLSDELAQLTNESWRLADLLRQLVPEIQVCLVRLCDGGHLYPCAKAKLNLLGSVADSVLTPDLCELISSEVTLDLFIPSERELFREECVRLASQGVLQRDNASRLPGQPTQALVSKSIQLDKRMRNLGLSSAFVMLDEPPADYAKLRRHRSRKYEFTSVPGHQRMTR